MIPAYNADPRLSPFTGADICARAGFTVQPGQRAPQFDDDAWDFAMVANLPVQVAGRDRYWNFAMIINPRWRLVAKELMFALLVPRHEAVAILPHAYRAPMALRTCIRRLVLLTRWLNWLTSEGVTGLGEVTEEHCGRFLAHCGHAHDKQGRQMREASASHRRQAVAVVLDLISYRELFTSDRCQADLRPWKGASSSAVVGMRPGRENKTQPVPDDVLRPLLAGSLLIVNTLAPHLIELRGELRAHRAHKMSDLSRRRQPTLQEMAAAVQQHTAAGEPLIQIPDYQIRHRLCNGWSADDPLLAVNFSALAQRIGCADYRHAWTDEALRRVVLEGIEAVGVAKQWCRQAALVTNTDTGEQVPWTVPLHTREVIDLIEVARAACLTITAAASGMRSSELMELLVGCRRPPQETAAGLRRFRIASKVVKGGSLGMSVGHPGRILARSWGRWRAIGPQVSITRARAASALWKPRARRKIRRTTLLRPSARPLLMFSRIAASSPSRNLRIVLAALTNAGRRERLALEIHRSISSATWAGLRSPAKMARKLPSTCRPARRRRRGGVSLRRVAAWSSVRLVGSSSATPRAPLNFLAASGSVVAQLVPGLAALDVEGLTDEFHGVEGSMQMVACGAWPSARTLLLKADPMSMLTASIWPAPVRAEFVEERVQGGGVLARPCPTRSSRWRGW